MSPDGNPIQVPASSLQAAGVQNGIYLSKKETKNCPEIVNKSKVHLNWVFKEQKFMNETKVIIKLSIYKLSRI